MIASSELHKHKTTPGEELYLVHLRRMREVKDDHDYMPRKRRSSSVGEELWEVHRRRSQGTEDDFDRDNNIGENHPSDHKSEVQKHVVTTPEGKGQVHKHRYNLRSADSPRKKA